MIAIEYVTEDELENRYATMPSGLKAALDSDRLLSVVKDVCSKYNLTDGEKSVVVEQLVGLVFFGLLHAYDLAAELNDALSLNNPKLAAAIADELNAKIFSPIKTDLETNYRPIVPNTKVPEAPAVPVATETIREKPPITGPKIIGDIQPATISVSAKPMPAPAPAKPPITGQGWSMQRPVNPPTLMSTPPSAPARAGSVPVPMPPPGAQAPKPAPAPAPFMMQSSSVPQPIKNAPNFRSSTGIENVMKGSGSFGSLSVKPAILEVGGAASKAPASSIGNIPASSLKTDPARSEKSVAAAPAPAPKPPIAEKGRTILEVKLDAPSVGTTSSTSAQTPKPAPAPMPTPSVAPSKPIGSAPAPMAAPIKTAPSQIIAQNPSWQTKVVTPAKPPTPPAPVPVAAAKTPISQPPLPGKPSPQILPLEMPKPPAGKVIVKDFKEGEK